MNPIVTKRCSPIEEAIYQDGFQSGATSRDAEIQRLQFALADAESLELGTAERCDQLRAQINMLREALEYCVTQVGELATVPGIASALSSTPEQSLAEYQNKVIEDCAKRAEAYAYMSQNFNALAEELRAMKEHALNGSARLTA